MNSLKSILWFFCFLHISVFLIANVDYDLFSSDNVKTFSSLGFDKAKGINLTFKYPGTWIYYKGERPNVLCRLYESLGDNKFVTVVVLIKDIPVTDKTDTDKKLASRILNTNNIAFLVPPGSTVIERSVTKYDDQPGMCLEFMQTQSMASIEGTMYFLNHMFIYKHKLIFVQCSIGGLSTDNTVAATFDEFKPLFINIGMSIVIPDKWNENDLEITNSDISNYKAVGYLALFILLIAITIIIFRSQNKRR